MQLLQATNTSYCVATSEQKNGPIVRHHTLNSKYTNFTLFDWKMNLIRNYCLFVFWCGKG